MMGKRQTFGFEHISLEVDSSHGIMMERMGCVHRKLEYCPMYWLCELIKLT